MSNEIYADIRLRIDNKPDFEKFSDLKTFYGDRFDTEVLRKAIREAHRSLFPATTKSDSNPDEQKASVSS